MIKALQGLRLVFGLLLVLGISGCVSTHSTTADTTVVGTGVGGPDVDGPSPEGSVASADTAVQAPNVDPWEPFNRKMFAFNDAVDTWVLVPLASAWDLFLPDPVQRGFSRFRENLASPIDFANNLLQGKSEAALVVMGRFVLNSTAGLGGVLDPASELGFPAKPEDLGQTLGVWGVPSGPYLVLPFWGPSSPRDLAGRIGDGFANIYPYVFEKEASYAFTAAGLINERAFLLDTVRNVKAASLDYYIALRSAYLERRSMQIKDSRPGPESRSVAPATDEDDLYFFEDEDEDDLYFFEEDEEETTDESE